MPWGFTDTGVNAPTEQELIDEVETALRATITPSLSLDNDTPEGQMTQVFMSKVAELWEALVAAKNATTIRANGISADDVAALTGTTRLAAEPSTVTATVTMDASTTKAIGEIRAYVVGSPDSIFVNTESVTSTTAGNYTVAMEAEETGPVEADPGTLTEFVAAVAGVSAITNVAAATLGRNIEDTPSLRTRRRQQLSQAGSNRDDSLRGQLLDLTGVKAADVNSNDTDFPVDGIPAHSFEAIVLGGTGTEIAQLIWDNKTGGIGSFGSSSANALDSQGNVQTLYYTVATERAVYLEVDVSVDATRYPADGDTQIAEAIEGFTSGSLLLETASGLEIDGELGMGEGLIVSALIPAIFTVSGVLDVTEIRAGFTASPAGTANLSIGAREIISDGSGNPGVPSANILVAST